MKQPKKLTRNQKVIIKKAGLIPEEWMLIKEHVLYLYIIKKDLSDRKIIFKRRGEIVSNEN